MSDELQTPRAREETHSRNPLEPRRYLLILDLSAPSSSIHHLPPMGELIIGRAQNVAVRVSDNLVSREHVKIKVTSREVSITDLGSQNGTRVNGGLIEADHVLASGDTITLSPQTTIVFHAPRARALPAEFLEARKLRARLDEEVERSSRYLRSVSALVIRYESAAELVVMGALTRVLRPIDLVATTPGETLIVLPELELEEAKDVARRFLGEASRRGATARVGHATYPGDGSDADAMIASARAAADEASSGCALAAADVSATIEVGEHSVIVADPAMIRLYSLAKKLAQSDVPVLILGETGSGKEVVAQSLHAWSKRNLNPFVSLNCAALPENLIESELFGYEKGAFTGAVASKVGHLERAHMGTLLLDEIGELPAPSQAKLLRVLETKQLLRLGATKEQSIDIRIVGATHKKLEDDVAQGTFRKDLYYRLNAATLILPPVRERPREIPLLARRLLELACEKLERKQMVISSRAMLVLLHYSWPGNIRELKNTMDYVAATATDEVLEIWQLPEHILSLVRQPGENDAKERLFCPIEDEVRDLERKRMAEALAVAGGVQKVAAELLSMPLRTFVTKLKRYELHRGHR